jgi:hypothetical protein
MLCRFYEFHNQVIAELFPYFLHNVTALLFHFHHHRPTVASLSLIFLVKDTYPYPIPPPCSITCTSSFVRGKHYGATCPASTDYMQHYWSVIIGWLKMLCLAIFSLRTSSTSVDDGCLIGNNTNYYSTTTCTLPPPPKKFTRIVLKR